MPTSRIPTARGSRFVLSCLLAGLVPIALGCGGGGESSAAEEEGQGTEVDMAGGPAPDAERNDTYRQDGNGRWWFGDIPRDVFYAEPLAIAADGRPVGSTGDPGGTPMPDPMPMDPEPMNTGGGDGGWDKLITAEIVDAEVTAIRNRMKQSLVSVAAYNSSHLSLPAYIHTLSVLGAVADEHPGEIRWKKHALVIRDKAGEIAAAGTPRGGPAGKKAIEEPFLVIEDTFAGSPPGGFTPAEEVLYSDIADMSELMKRLDIGFNKRLVIDVGSQESLVEKKDFVKHEASIVAVLGKVITLEGYGYLDDDDFKGHAQGMIDAGVQMVQAAESGDFDQYDAAKTMIIKACTDCHRTYR